MATQKKKVPVKQTESAQPSRGLTPFDEFERLMDDYFNRNWFRSLRPSTKFEDLWGTYEMRSPSTDIIDRDKEVIIRAELPGVDKKDLEVTVSDDTVTIKATASQESKEEKENYYHSEIRKGAYSRTLSLPAGVDSSNVKATFTNGLLELTIPKLAKAERKTIKIT